MVRQRPRDDKSATASSTAKTSIAPGTCSFVGTLVFLITASGVAFMLLLPHSDLMHVEKDPFVALSPDVSAVAGGELHEAVDREIESPQATSRSLSQAAVEPPAVTRAAADVSFRGAHTPAAFVPSAAPTSPPSLPVALDTDALAKRVEELRLEVLRVKRNLRKGSFMEKDPAAVKATSALQQATTMLLEARYGKGRHRVALDLHFPPMMAGPPDARIVLELAPFDLVPHAVHTFLEAMVENWQGAAFHRVAPHVLQVLVHGHSPGLAFQEYSPAYPHRKGTVGFAGRPGGPHFYVSIQDNVANHGPGSQQHENPYEADACFAKVVEGFDDIVLQRMTKQPGHEFIEDVSKHILIKRVQLMRDDGTQIIG